MFGLAILLVCFRTTKFGWFAGNLYGVTTCFRIWKVWGLGWVVSTKRWAVISNRPIPPSKWALGWFSSQSLLTKNLSILLHDAFSLKFDHVLVKFSKGRSIKENYASQLWKHWVWPFIVELPSLSEENKISLKSRSMHHGSSARLPWSLSSTQNSVLPGCYGGP